MTRSASSLIKIPLFCLVVSWQLFHAKPWTAHNEVYNSSHIFHHRWYQKLVIRCKDVTDQVAFPSRLVDLFISVQFQKGGTNLLKMGESSTSDCDIRTDHRLSRGDLYKEREKKKKLEIEISSRRKRRHYFP